MVEHQTYRPQRVLGVFKSSKEGGWEGCIRTLTIERKIRLVPNDNRMSDKAPAFRVMMGWQVLGDAWEAHSRSDPPRPYLRVELDDPFCPMSGFLFPADDGMTARFIWQRERDTLHGK